jgi:hypothetical protein
MARIAVSAAVVSHQIFTGKFFLLLALKQTTNYLTTSPVRLYFPYFAD